MCHNLIKEWRNSIHTAKNKMENLKVKKASITNFEKRKTGYGHWKITVELENPNLLLSNDDYYWQLNDIEDEQDYVKFTHITTNSSAIDGHDGYEVALAQECLNANEVNIDLVDFTTLKEFED